MYQYKNCPVCEHAGFSHFLEVKDYTVSQEIFQIDRCDECGFLFTNPRPDDASLGKYYQSSDYISHSDTKRGLVAKLYHTVRKYTLKRKVQLVSNYVSRGSILDYGCGTGYFLQACENAGWKAMGIEPDKGARKTAFENGHNVSESRQVLDSKISDLKFNAITLWHVLEHVPDLNETLRYFSQKLTREGVVVIAVPNHSSYDATHYGAYWAAYDVPRHLYHFSPETIIKLFNKHGFVIQETLPMVFDSYYVSLLSEKYKNGSNRLFPAFWTGFKSNLKAKKPTEYSSVVYVFKAK